MSTEPNFRAASSLPAEQADLRRQQEVQKSIAGSVPPFAKGGRLVSGSLTDANEGSVSHGLRRSVKGWFLVSPSGSADRVSLIQTFSDGNVIKLKNLGATGGLSFQLWVW